MYLEMISTTRSCVSRLAFVGPANMTLMQQAMLFIEEAIQEIEINVNGELDLITKEQFALCEVVKMTSDSFTDWLIAMEIKVEHL